MIALTKEDFHYNNVRLINMVKNGFDVYTELEADNWCSKTFYEAAIEYGTPELVQACIDMGANPDCINLKLGACTYPPAATSSLITAIRAFRPDNLKVLIEAGANPQYLYIGHLNWHLRTDIFPEATNSQNLGFSELTEIVNINNHLIAGAEIISVLKDAGFRIPGMKPNDWDSSLYSVSFCSASSINGDDDDKWYTRKPKEDDSFDSSTKYYSEEYYTDGWPCLLPGHGSRSNAVWHAVSPDALTIMLEEGVDVANVRDELGYTMLHHLAFYGSGDYYFKPEVMMQVLIDNGADVNDANEYGVCPLLLAAEEIRPHKKSLELVKVLLRNGADYTAKTADNRDIEYWSSNYWYTTGDYENNILWEITSELIRSVRGESKLSDNDIDLMTAVFWGDPLDVNTMLERGANVNATTEHGYTPLMFASIYNEAETVEFLIDNGAKIDVKNANGESALYLANLTEDESVISTLIEKGADKSCLLLPQPEKKSTTRMEILYP